MPNFPLLTHTITNKQTNKQKRITGGKYGSGYCRDIATKLKWNDPLNVAVEQEETQIICFISFLA